LQCSASYTPETDRYSTCSCSECHPENN
jgi:hypothetical protein